MADVTMANDVSGGMDIRSCSSRTRNDEEKVERMRFKKDGTV